MSNKELKDMLMGLVRGIVAEVDKNEEFASLLINALSKQQPKKKKRERAVLNPVMMLIDGDDSLSEKLQNLSEEQLKDIIAEYGMDSAKLAMKWKSKERLIALIVETSERRASKGDVFRE